MLLTDKEVRGLIQDSYERAKGLLTRNLQVLHRVAEVLLEKESLDGSDIDNIIKQFGATDDLKSSESVAAAAS